MAITSIEDLKVHIPFLNEYLPVLATERSAFVRSGICATDPNIAALVQAAGPRGDRVQLPFWNDLNGDDEAMDEGASLTPQKITAGQDVAGIIRRAKAFSSYDLAAAFSGQKPISVIASLIADYKVRQRQKALFAILKGVFADNEANDGGDLINDITEETGDAAFLDKFTILETAQLLGDAKDKLTAVAMNSAAELALTKVSYANNAYIPASQTPNKLPSYAGFSVIVDDACAYDPDTGIAEIYLFGQGAFALQDALGAEPALETYRDELSSVSGLIERDFYIMHPRGVKWTSPQLAKSTPQNSDLEAAASWDRVYDKKNIRLAKLVCKIK